jgi:hypothetical protein
LDQSELHNTHAARIACLIFSPSVAALPVKSSEEPQAAPSRLAARGCVLCGEELALWY